MIILWLLQSPSTMAGGGAQRKSASQRPNSQETHKQEVGRVSPRHGHDRFIFFTLIWLFDWCRFHPLHWTFPCLCPPCYLQLLARWLPCNRYSIKTFWTNTILWSRKKRQDGRLWRNNLSCSSHYGFQYGPNFQKFRSIVTQLTFKKSLRSANAVLCASKKKMWFQLLDVFKLYPGRLVNK